MAVWRERYGRWWAVQWCWDGWLSFGLHLDLKSRQTLDHVRYGPLLDLHIGWFIVSFGRNPIFATELDASKYRTGIRDGVKDA